MTQEVNMFERATRTKLRFPSSHGLLSVEDLWTLNLKNARGPSLNEVAQLCDQALKQEPATKSFVDDNPDVDPALQLRMDIVLHIIDIKKSEAAARETANAKAAQKQKLLGLLDQAQNAELAKKTPEELRAMLDAL